MAQPDRRRGRPALSPNERSTDVCVKMPDSLYDQAYERATKQRTNVPELMRRSLKRALNDDTSR